MSLTGGDLLDGLAEVGAGPRIAVFGSGAPMRPDHPAYEEAFRLGRLLAAAGCIVLTGGYDGTMAAVSRGAWSVGGRILGITMSLFVEPPNPWLSREVRVDRFAERLAVLCDHADGYVVLPGGVGTLNELGYAWSILLTGAVPRRPLVLVGPSWRRLVSCFRAEGFPLQPEIEQFTEFVATPEEAVAALRQHLVGQRR